MTQITRPRIWEYVTCYFETCGRFPEYVIISREEAVELILDEQNEFVRYSRARGFPTELIVMGPTGTAIRCRVTEEKDN